MHVWDAVHALATRNVYLSQKKLPGVDHEYVLRKIFRYYSKTFATPLQEVYELPLLTVLQHYYEDTIESYDEPELDALVREVMISDKRQLELDLFEDKTAADDHDMIRDTRIENTNAAKRLEDVVPKVRDALQEMVRQARGGGGKEAELIPSRKGGQLPAKLEPSIRMKFISEEELERELNKEEGVGPLNLFPKARSSGNL